MITDKQAEMVWNSLAQNKDLSCAQIEWFYDRVAGILTLPVDLAPKNQGSVRTKSGAWIPLKNGDIATGEC